MIDENGRIVITESELQAAIKDREERELREQPKRNFREKLEAFLPLEARKKDQFEIDEFMERLNKAAQEAIARSESRYYVSPHN